MFIKASPAVRVVPRAASHLAFSASPRSRSTAWYEVGCWVVAAACFAACGSSYPESEYPPNPPPGVEVAPNEAAPAPPGAMWREDLLQALEAGLGRFLQKVTVEPEMKQGAFVGFRIVELRPPAWWQGIDLAPGDVVTSVNGMPIEQPAEAHAAFESLRTADKLTVKYLRGGEPRELTYRIIDKPGTSSTQPSAAPKPDPAPSPPPAAPSVL